MKKHANPRPAASAAPRDIPRGLVQRRRELIKRLYKVERIMEVLNETQETQTALLAQGALAHPLVLMSNVIHGPWPIHERARALGRHLEHLVDQLKHDSSTRYLYNYYIETMVPK